MRRKTELSIFAVRSKSDYGLFHRILIYFLVDILMRLQKIMALTCISVLALTCYRGEDFNWPVIWGEQFIDMDKVIWGNGEFIANGGVMNKSVDGKTWVRSDTGVGNLIWGGGQYVEIGILGFSISISPDAVTWRTTLKTYPSVELHDIVWDNSQYIAVGDAGTIMISPDGISWTSVNSGITEDLQRIIWGRGRYILFSGKFYRMTKVYTSTDGLVWSKIDFPADVILAEQTFKDATWGEPGFVISGEPLSYFSSDGVTWKKLDQPLSAEAIIWCNDSRQYIGVKSGGGWFDAPRIYTSDEGNIWYEHINTKYAGDMFFSMYFTSIACHGDTYVAGGNCEGNSYSCLMYSP